MYSFSMANSTTEAVRGIAAALERLGIHRDDLILVHSSFKALGTVPGGPDTVIAGVLAAVGGGGTLLMPALSYMQQPHEVHDTRLTPSNIGVISERFRMWTGVARSLHPTHSVCGIGPLVDELFRRHVSDDTPCGPNSPFSLMIDCGAKIVMLGCGLRPNTAMHAVEEHVAPPYLFGGECLYRITDGTGEVFEKRYRHHGFKGFIQRYDRITELAKCPVVASGTVLAAKTVVIDAKRLREAGLAALRDDPLFFVEATA